MSAGAPYEVDPYEPMVVPRAGLSLPLRLPEPDGFVPDRLETWPQVDGRLEYVQGSLLYMPPCGDDQQDTAADVVTELNLWRRAHEEFVVGGNEAGMRLGDDIRGAEAAVWRRADLGANTGGLRRAPPVLAVEVAGKDDTVAMLRDKARWYLDHGVEAVWLLVPRTRRVIVITPSTESEHGDDATLPAHASLPGLAPRVSSLFRQLG